MPDEPQIPPELAGFLQQLRSLVPPHKDHWQIWADGDYRPGNAVEVRLAAFDPVVVTSYLNHLHDHGTSILAQVEQVIVGLAQKAREFEVKFQDEKIRGFANDKKCKGQLAPDSCAEDALFALMTYLLSLRGLL